MVFLNNFINPTTINLSIIISLFLITYVRILGKDFYWVIDDLEGIARFSETWNEKEQKVNDSYDLNGKQVKYLSFIKELGFPGNIFRFLRLHLGKKYQVIGKNAKGHDVFGYVQSPRRHHMISMSVQILNLVMAYTFLCNIVPAPIALGTCLLYSVHPLTTQSVAWISGYNYNFSMFFSLALLNVALTYHIPELKYLFIAILSAFSTITIYTGGFTCFVLLFLGLKLEALCAGIVGLAIILWKGFEMKDFRVKAFKEQNMGNTTFFKPRKIIVMFKTLWYYMRIVFLPLRMGLYHTWGYFYEEPIERVDRMFWLGLATFSGFIGLIFSGVFALQFGAVWFLTFFFLFSNFITAQQFIADRYVMVPSFGICVMFAYLLQGTPFFWILLGLYAMRTFLHLPAYKNEVDFYGSNFMNFRKSEVSLGNLGVGFMNQGMHGAAVDTWMMATKINPHYDVPWYNLYSVFKGNGRLAEAKTYLENCLKSKVVHFEQRWTEELKLLNAQIEQEKTPVKPTEMFYHQAADHYKSGSTSLELQALRSFMAGDTTGLIPEMITQVKARLEELESANRVQLHNSCPEPQRPEVTGPHPVDSRAGVPAGSN